MLLVRFSIKLKLWLVLFFMPFEAAGLLLEASWIELILLGIKDSTRSSLLNKRSGFEFSRSFSTRLLVLGMTTLDSS